MKHVVYSTDILEKLFAEKKIATLAELKAALGTDVSLTVFRKLKALKYRSSYSHRGQYYTLDSLIDFDRDGLWQCNSVLFSRHGTLRETARTFVHQSNAGYSARELHDILHIDVKEPLLGLFRAGEIHREKFSGQYIYFAKESSSQKRQMHFRKQQLEVVSIPVGLQSSRSQLLVHELKAAIVLFFSLLNEKQRRLYAGLESLKLGHGGDKSIAELLLIDPHTVAKGRQELLRGEVAKEQVRQKGGGRKPVLKKLRKS